MPPACLMRLPPPVGYNQKLADALRRRQLKLLRHQVSVQAEFNRFLALLDNAIIAQIVSISPGEPARDLYRQRRVDKLIEAVAASISDTYSDMQRFTRKELQGLADVEALFLINKVNDLFGSDAARLALSSSEALALVDDTLIHGAVLKTWWRNQAITVQDRFAQEMRIGMIAGESDADLVRRVRGTKEMGFKDGLMEVSRRMGKILVRASSSSIVGATRKKAVLDNPDVFDGIQQISVLDGRTSHTCIAYAGKVWSVPGYKPVGHSLPYNGGVPRHPNCRSTEIPVIREALGGAPAEDVGFDSFLKTLAPTEVDALLGSGRADLYRSGKITLADLVDQQGRPLTLEQLRNTF